MLTKKLACPSCHVNLKVADTLPPGKLIKCPKCGKGFPVPGDSAETPAPSPDAGRQESAESRRDAGPAASRTVPVAAAADRSSGAVALFQANCARCHTAGGDTAGGGRGGRGKG